MSNIQLVLIASLFILLFLYLSYFRNRIFNALFFFCFFLVGIGFIINPSITQRIATFFGVGRGVDLVIYLLMVVFFFLFIAIFYRMRQLGKTIIDLVRIRAIDTAVKLGKNQ
jgi:small membrane protein